jgi:hypothetical protein
LTTESRALSAAVMLNGTVNNRNTPTKWLERMGLISGQNPLDSMEKNQAENECMTIPARSV